MNLSIKDIHKSFGQNHVLKGIDISFQEPGVSAIVGPNGSGKTTIIKCILGMVIPDSGEISVGGQSIKGDWKYRDQIDYVPQIAKFPENLQVSELLEMIKDIRPGQTKADELIQLFEVESFEDRRLGNLSGGMRQKVNLILALMYDSPIIILDEPTAGLDPVALIKLKNLIDEEREKGKIILITTHIMSLVDELADNVVFLLDGHIKFAGSVNELKQSYGGHKIEESIANILIDNQQLKENPINII